MNKVDLLNAPDLVKSALVIFSFGNQSNSSLSFQLLKTRPTDSMKSALDQAVDLKILSVEKLNFFGGLIYKSLVDCSSLSVWAEANQLRLIEGGDLHIIPSQPFANEQEMIAWMTPFGQGIWAKERENKNANDNPYPPRSADHHDWAKGFGSGCNIDPA